MSPDEFQTAWQTESARTRISIDADVLLKGVQRSQQDFRMMILARDFREVGVAILLIPMWFVMGYLFSPVWTWYLCVPAIIWSAGFIIVDRMRHKRPPSNPDDPLLDSAKESLAQVEHQIWLLRNVAWWYLLPYAVPIAIFFLHTSWVVTGSAWGALLFASLPTAFVGALYTFLYYLNQRAVRKQLEPRRRELAALLTSLTDESSDEVRGEFPILTNTKNIGCSRRRAIIGTVIFFAILVIDVPLILYFARDSGDDYSKRAPFTDVHWANETPMVTVDGESCLLYSIDGIDTKDIAAFCKKTYGDKWQKRFAEDLVEVMTKMGHTPGDSVQLDLSTFKPKAERIKKEVPMTAANRRAVRNAAQSRERAQEMLDKHSAVSSDEPAVPLAEQVSALRAENKLVGLAAMVMVDGEVVASAVDGERKKGSGAKCEVGDQWHLGSITKSVTATMIARLVESGKMKFSDTVGMYFPEASVHADWKPVTLRQLLTHTAGAPANFSLSVRRQKPALGAECTQARREAVLDVLAKKPEYPPGADFAYSNVGFTIAGAMAEKATGEAWSDLVTREVFDPLQLTGAGFGPPKSVNKKLEQPQGHTTAFWWKVGMGEDADNTFIMGPAGIVHMTLTDLCTYATEHLRGEAGKGTLLSTDTYKLLHTPQLDNYACGWVKKEADADIPHTVYWHNGSNTMWYALVVFIPDTKMVVAVTSNDGDIKKADAAAWKIVGNSAKQRTAEVEPPAPQTANK